MFVRMMFCLLWGLSFCLVVACAGKTVAPLIAESPQCKRAYAYTLGYADGSEGRAMSSESLLRCPRTLHGFLFSFYEQGYERGLEDYDIRRHKNVEAKLESNYDAITDESRRKQRWRCELIARESIFSAYAASEEQAREAVKLKCMARLRSEECLRPLCLQRF